jgi:integrase
LHWPRARDSGRRILACWPTHRNSRNDRIPSRVWRTRKGTDNYRKRTLQRLARDFNLPKLTFQVIRRSIATLAQKKGTVKDVQGLLRHSRAATTTDVYMQEIPESVRATVDAIGRELRSKSKPGKSGKKIANLRPNAPKSERKIAVSY